MNDNNTLLYPNSTLTGESLVDYEKREAKTSLYLSDQMRENGANVAAWMDKAQGSGNPPWVYSETDNTELPKSYDLDNISPLLRRALAYSPQYTAYFKDYIPEWEDVIAELQKRKNRLAPPPPLQQKKNPNDMTSQEFEEYLRSMSDEELQARIDAPKIEDIQAETRRLEKQNAAANFLMTYWNDKSYKVDDDTLKARLQVFSEMTGASVDDIDLEDLKETKGVEVSRNLFNVFGALDIYDAGKVVSDWRKYNDLDLTKVDENSPLDQQIYKLELLRKEREMLRDETMSTKILNGAIGSVPFMLEFGLTAGVAGGLHAGSSFGSKQLLKTLVTSGYREVLRKAGAKGLARAVGQGLKEVAISGAKRLPFYIPKITAETLSEVAPSTITLIGDDGKPTVSLSEKDATDFFQRFITNALSQYSELASEEVGGLLSNVMPKFVQNYVVHNLVSNPMSRKIANRIIDRVSWDGLLGEFSEEEIGNFMMYGVTLLENALQFRKQNTPMVDSPVLGKEESLVTLGSIALQGALLTGTSVAFSRYGERALIKNAIAARGVIENADAIVAGLKKISSVGDNTNQLKVAIDTLNGGESGYVEITVDDAEAMFQAVKKESPEAQKDLLEAYEAIGLTEQKIAEHRRKGTDITLSDSQIFAVARNYKSGLDALHNIFKNTATAVFGKTVKDFASESFAKEQIDAILEERVRKENALKRWGEIIHETLKTAQENAVAAGNPMGVSRSAVRNFETVFPMLVNYLGTNAIGEDGVKRVEELVKGLSVKFIANPETFSLSGAMQELYNDSRVQDAQAKVDELKTKLETMQKENKASGEEYLKTAEDYQKAKQELEEAKANPEVLNQIVLFQKEAVAANNKSVISEEEAKWLDDVLKSGDYVIAYRAAQVIDGKLYPPMAAQVAKGKLTKNIKLKSWEKSYEQFIDPELIAKWEREGVGSVKPGSHPYFPLPNASKTDWKRNEDGSIALYFRLYKGKVKDKHGREKEVYVDARYDPYIHSSPIPLNDQFSSAWARDGIVILEVLVPRNEIYPEDSQHYKAPYAYLSTGAHTWKGGPVARYIGKKDAKKSKKGEAEKDKLAPFSTPEEAAKAGGRAVYLSRYDYPIRIVPNEEVAQKIKETIAGQVDYLPHNVLTPSLRSELEKIGVPIVEMEEVPSGKGTKWVRKDNGKDYTGNLMSDEQAAALYQGFQPQADGSAYNGIFMADFENSRNSLIGLFSGANASTLPHESAHWLKKCMEDLIGAGLANDKMIEDMNTINAWLAKQDYSEKAAREIDAENMIQKDGTVNRKRMEEEYFARAFEMYLWEGKFPETATPGLKGALYRLANVLKTIYRTALDLNAPIDQSIRDFFDNIFAVEQTVEETGVLSAILRELNAGAITMKKDELKNLEADLVAAKEDAETEQWLAAFREFQHGLNANRKNWRAEANAAYMADKAEQALNYVRKGHRISEDFLRNVLKLDERTIAILKAKRLTVKGTPAKVKSEAPAQEEAQVEVPMLDEETEDADVPPVVLEGVNEGNVKNIWKSIDKDTPVVIQDVDTLSVVLDMLIAKGEFHNEQLNEVYWKLTQVGKKSGLEYYKVNKDGKVRTKENFENLVYDIIHKKNVKDFEEQDETDHIDNPDQNGQTGHEKIAAKRTSSPEVLKKLFDKLEEVVNEIKDDEDKLIADVILRRAREEEDIRDKNGVNGEILQEYIDMGGTLGKSARYTHLRNVRKIIAIGMQERGVYIDLYGDFELLQTEKEIEVPADILAILQATGYKDPNSLIADLQTAVGRTQFIKDFMSERETEYRETFLDNPKWNTESGALMYLDALLKALKLTQGVKFSERVKLARAEAKREIEEGKTLREIRSEERNAQMSLKANAESILKTLKGKKHDKEAAITAAVFMHANAARLEALRAIRADVEEMMRFSKRLGKLKPGSSVEGDAVNAIRAVLYDLKLTSSRPQWSGEPEAPNSVTTVLMEIAERSIGERGFTTDMLGKDGMPTAGQIVEQELAQWSKWLMNQISGGEGFVNNVLDLTVEQFHEVKDFLKYLRNAGHDTVATDKATFAAKRKETIEAILASLDENATGKYKRHIDKNTMEKLQAMARTGGHQLKTLVFMAHFLDGNSEFYGEHKIGAFRKLQLKVSEGVAKQQFWYQKISSAVKPHMLALMNSAKDRKLKFDVNNEITKDVYEDIHGEMAAFVLLNAGQVEGRQRLMSGFGWTEEQLNNNLAQFTEEDFRHAEAIWAELNTLGRELAKVFYQQRHYRMKWAQLAPINIILNDGKGTHIMSDGGYYPLAYSYREGDEVRNDDIMNPFRAPARLARPSATYSREARVENAALLLSPSVIERSIMENSRYIGLWEPLRLMNSIWTDGAVKRSIIKNFSEEAYSTLRDLMGQVNDPDRGERGKWKKVVSYLGSAMAVAALGFKATTMAKQYASLSIGAERLKAYDPKTGQARSFFMESFQKGLTDLRKLRRDVSEMSPFIRDRYNLIDKDLKVVNSEFKGKFGKAVDTYRRWAFFGLKWNDLNVAVVQWDAAYNWALFTQKDITPSEARAFADDFVASTQGGARDIDIPEVQLSTFGRLITPFFGPSAAAANTRIAGLSTMRDMTPAERIMFVVDNLLIPGLEQAVVMAVSAGAVGWAVTGGDDDDAWDRVQQKFLVSMLTEPLSGIPMIQDISDAAIRSAVTGKPVQSGVFDVSLFRPLEESTRDFTQIMRNMKNMEDFGYSVYLGACIAGMLTRMPIVQVFEDYERMLINNGLLPYMYQQGLWFSDKRIEQQLKGEKRK